MRTAWSSFTRRPWPGVRAGALLTHRNFISADVHLNLLMHLSPADVHLNLLPLFHVGGLFMATMAFHAGALNINMSKFDAGPGG